MKLRYLHLKEYPPLKVARIAFSASSPLQRECAIHFIVGINGSGKSHLLQAISEVFLSLADWRPPHFPASLIYELGTRTKLTVIVSALRSSPQSQPAMWVSEKHVFEREATTDDFDRFVSGLYDAYANSLPLPFGYRAVVEPGSWTSAQRGATAELAYLPRAVLTYTTGSEEPWEALWWRYSALAQLPEDTLAEVDAQEERPSGWTYEKERLATGNTDPQMPAPRIGFRTDYEDQLLSEGRTNTEWRPILLEAEFLKFAVLATALPMTWKDHESVLEPIYTKEPDEPWWESLRRLFKRADIDRIVGVRVTLNFDLLGLVESGNKTMLQRLLPWFLCCTESVSQPAPSTLRDLYFDFGASFDFSDRVPPDMRNSGEFDFLASSLNHLEALMALIGSDVSSTPERAFQSLFAMRTEGWLEGIQLIVKKVGLEDLISFDDLSDGERMVLGRMALFYLLQGQQDALLLLDEPETHFNDKWKREIVDIIDEAIGNTANDVLISTHSAIVLSDVFNNEIVMVEKASNGASVRAVDEPTFAADPSALMMTVFGADDSIGKRAQEFIERKLKQATGTRAEMVDLERLIARMGSGFYRSELRTLLNTWRGGNA